MSSPVKTLRPAQAEAVAWLRSKRRGCVVAPAGSGKTIIAAGALRNALDARQRDFVVKVGWMANTIEQCSQAVAALQNFGLLNDRKIEIKIACVAAATDWTDRHVLVVDEAHHAASAKSWQEQIQKCKGAIWGFTATPPADTDPRDLAFRKLFEEFHFIARSEVAHTLSSAEVYFHRASDDVQDAIDRKIEKDMKWRERYFEGGCILQVRRALSALKLLRVPGVSHPKLEAQIAENEARLEQFTSKLWGQVAWQACIELGIVANRQRNEAALMSARKHTEPTLILVNQVEHAKWFAEQLPGAVACHASMGKKKRAQALADFTAGKVQRLVATSLADEGLDLPCAAVLILVSAGRSEAKTVQRTGRVLRKCEGKAGAIIYDFTDETAHPLMAKHARRRQEIYEQLGYKIL